MAELAAACGRAQGIDKAHQSRPARQSALIEKGRDYGTMCKMWCDSNRC